MHTFYSTLAKVQEQVQTAVVQANRAGTVAEESRMKVQQSREDTVHMLEESKEKIIQSIREIRVQGEEVSKRLAKLESSQIEMESRLLEESELG